MRPNGESHKPRLPAMIEPLFRADGSPRCDVPDDCPVCVLVTHPAEGESRMDWARRAWDRTLTLEYLRLGFPRPSADDMGVR